MTTSPPEVAAQTLVLPDGRRLAWREYGDRDGTPCVYTTGTPASGLAGAVHHEAARTAGVRWISLDKPGCGLSDFQPGRRLLDWPDDVTAVADHLGLERFAVAGESGGGPHALAIAHSVPDRVATTAVIAGLGPATEAWARKGMKRQNRMFVVLGQRAPWALRPAAALTRVMFSSNKRAQRYVESQAKQSPSDREAFEDPTFTGLVLAASRDAFRSGARGVAQELAILVRPWGFELREVRGHVDLWHGENDVNVPIAIARAVAEALPDCKPRFIKDAGHLLSHSHLDEVMAAIEGARDEH